MSFPLVRQEGAAPPLASESLLIDIYEFAALVGTSDRSIRRLNSAARIPVPIKLGGKTKWRRAEVLAWVAAGCPTRKVWEQSQKGRS